MVIVGLEEPIARPQRTIEALSAGQEAPAVIVVSSLNSRDHIRKAMLAGARDYLGKPIRSSELQQAIVAAYEAEQHRRKLSDSTRRQGEVIVVFGAKGASVRRPFRSTSPQLLPKRRARGRTRGYRHPASDVAVMLDLVPEHTIVDAAEMVDRRAGTDPDTTSEDATGSRPGGADDP